MWYFTWVLGLGLAVAFGILNGMWHEFHLVDSGDDGLDDIFDHGVLLFGRKNAPDQLDIDKRHGVSFLSGPVIRPGACFSKRAHRGQFWI